MCKEDPWKVPPVDDVLTTPRRSPQLPADLKATRSATCAQAGVTMSIYGTDSSKIKLE